MRYQIRVLNGERVSVSGRDYECSLLEFVGETNDASEAKRIATCEGGCHPYGTAIVDTEARTVNCGTDENGAPWIVPLDDVYQEVL